MSMADDLLGVAREMAQSPVSNWEQARLRRAVSTAYYALFHFLLEQASARFVDDPAIQSLVSRGFSHSDLQKAATTFKSGALPIHIKSVFPDPIPIEIVQLSTAFVTLQQARHAAEYDLLQALTHQQVITHVTAAEQAFAAFRTLLANPAAKNAIDLFLSSLLLIDRWKK